jgi:TRAP-type uncharacterized transport system substrate-binding protein
LVGVGTAVCIGAGLFAYRYFTDPVTLTVAAGSVDGHAAQMMTSIAGRLTKTGSSIRLKVVPVDTAFDAAKAFSAGSVDLAVIRADVGDLSETRTVVLMAHGVVMLMVPPGSPFDSIDAVKNATIGVVDGEANRRVVNVLKREYDFDQHKVIFKDVTPENVAQALRSKEIDAALFVLPVTEKYLALVRARLPKTGKKMPALIAIDSAGAIANVFGAYESYDLPKGTLWGSPPVPENDLTTLRVPFYLVANKKLNDDNVADLTRAIMDARRELVAEFPLLSQIGAPNTDKDAFIPIHPGAAAYYGGTEQSFFDKYSNELTYGPIVLGALMSGLVAAWKFLGFGGLGGNANPLDGLYALGRRIRAAQTEAELGEIEGEIDEILKSEIAKRAGGDETAVDPGTLSLMAHRLEYLIHYRRRTLASGAAPPPVSA